MDKRKMTEELAYSLTQGDMKHLLGLLGIKDNQLNQALVETSYLLQNFVARLQRASKIELSD